MTAVQNDLLEEVQKRYPEGTEFISPESGKKFIVRRISDDNGGFYYSSAPNSKDILCRQYSHVGGEYIFYNNKWAEVINSPKISEWTPRVGDWVIGWHSDFELFKIKAWQIGEVHDKFKWVKPLEKLDYSTGINHIRKAYSYEIPQASGTLPTPDDNYFMLPEKWCVLRNKFNHKVINKWLQEKFPNTAPHHDCGYIRINEDKDDWESSAIVGLYTEITFAQFKKYILNEKKELITRSSLEIIVDDYETNPQSQLTECELSFVSSEMVKNTHEIFKSKKKQPIIIKEKRKLKLIVITK